MYFTFYVFMWLLATNITFECVGNIIQYLKIRTVVLSKKVFGFVVIHIYDIENLINVLHVIFFSGLGDVAFRLRELQESCESLPDCHEVIIEYADKLRINNDFDRVCKPEMHEVTRF